MVAQWPGLVGRVRRDHERHYGSTGHQDRAGRRSGRALPQEPAFAFPEAVRRIIYTTNAIEALNAKLRRAVKIRGHFPNDEAATKLIYLVLRQTAAEWKMPREWGEAKTQFAIMFEQVRPGMMVNRPRTQDS